MRALRLRINIKLFATLAPYLPPDAAKNMALIEVAADTTVNQLIQQFKLPMNLVHLVLLNGRFVAEEDRDAQLAEGDTLAVWPPVAGG